MRSQAVWSAKPPPSSLLSTPTLLHTFLAPPPRILPTLLHPPFDPPYPWHLSIPSPSRPSSCHASIPYHPYIRPHSLYARSPSCSQLYSIPHLSIHASPILHIPALPPSTPLPSLYAHPSVPPRPALPLRPPLSPSTWLPVFCIVSVSLLCH